MSIASSMNTHTDQQVIDKESQQPYLLLDDKAPARHWLIKETARAQNARLLLATIFSRTKFIRSAQITDSLCIVGEGVDDNDNSSNWAVTSIVVCT